jgi:hypothetical protein
MTYIWRSFTLSRCRNRSLGQISFVILVLMIFIFPFPNSSHPLSTMATHDFPAALLFEGMIPRTCRSGTDLSFHAVVRISPHRFHICLNAGDGSRHGRAPTPPRRLLLRGGGDDAMADADDAPHGDHDHGSGGAQRCAGCNKTGGGAIALFKCGCASSLPLLPPPHPPTTPHPNATPPTLPPSLPPSTVRGLGWAVRVWGGGISNGAGAGRGRTGGRAGWGGG